MADSCRSLRAQEAQVAEAKLTLPCSCPSHHDTVLRRHLSCPEHPEGCNPEQQSQRALPHRCGNAGRADQPESIFLCLAVPGLAAPVGGWMHVRRYFMLRSKPVQTKQSGLRSKGKTLHGERTTLLAHKGPLH